MTQTTISVYYSRIPKELRYNYRISVDRLDPDSRELDESMLEEAEVEGARMEDIVARMHVLLQKYPDAEVTMLQELTRPGIYRRVNRSAYKLTPRETALIRADLPGALRLFAPIEQTVVVRPTGTQVPQAKEKE